MTLLIGTSISGRGGDTGRREMAAQQSLAGLAASGEAVCVNLAFADEAAPTTVIPSLAVLRLDAPRVSGARGARKPIVSEMIDALVSEAERRAMTRVALVNGDIVVTRAAVARSREDAGPAVAIGRTETGGAAPETQLLYGVDMFAFDTAFWRRHRRRFRAYPLGEAVWDNVYAAIVISHGGVLRNRERLIVHERHPSASGDSPFARYVHQLATRDRSYFTLWCTYVAAAERLRARHGSESEEVALQRSIFRPPGRIADAADVARAAWWRVKGALLGA